MIILMYIMEIIMTVILEHILMVFIIIIMKGNMVPIMMDLMAHIMMEIMGIIIMENMANIILVVQENFMAEMKIPLTTKIMKMQNIILICLLESKVVNVIAMKIVLMIKDVLNFHLADRMIMMSFTMRKVLYVL